VAAFFIDFADMEGGYPKNSAHRLIYTRINSILREAMEKAQ
jgi:hypothetical protein